MDFIFEDLAKREHVRLVQELCRDLELIRSLKAPSLTDFLNAPVIEGWRIGTRSEPALLGTVTGHPLLLDGPVTTSTLHYLDPVVGCARTFSRWYRLGTPAGD